MNIIELAKQAGLYVGTNLSGVTLVGAAKSNGLLIHLTVDDLASFAHLVRAAVLEEAAGVCRELDNEGNTDAYAAAAGFCAERIEALKEKT